MKPMTKELRVVYEQDPETGDYSAYFHDASETVGLGATKEEAYLSLLRTWQYVKALEAQELSNGGRRKQFR